MQGGIADVETKTAALEAIFAQMALNLTDMRKESEEAINEIGDDLFAAGKRVRQDGRRSPIGEWCVLRWQLEI